MWFIFEYKNQFHISLLGGPTPVPSNPCGKNQFYCKAHSKCIPQFHVCDFENDCPNGEDEMSTTCGFPQGFDMEIGFGRWANSLDDDYEYVLFHELIAKYLTAPLTDAKGDRNGMVL